MLFVTHDRYLVDLLATRLWILENGKITEFAGNYSQYREYLRAEQQQRTKEKKEKAKPQTAAQPSHRKLNQERERIEAEIFRCEQEKSELEARMADPEFYQDPDEVKRVNQIYQKLTTELEDYYQQWEQLVDTIQIKDDE
jgi:ATP-binding cassette subfamily F protein 3